MSGKRQAGFTLLELMIASTASLLILLPAFAVLLRTITYYSEMQSQLALNRQARAVIDALGNGARFTTAGKDGTPRAYGLRGSKKVPGGPQRKNFALEYKNNNFTVTSDTFAAVIVPCIANGLPIPDCKDDHSTKTVTGWLGDDVSLVKDKRSVSDRTVETLITITDPVSALRMKNPAMATETYRTILTLNRDEDDP